MMEEATYKGWWALHLRAVRGQILNPKEQDEYEVGLRQLHGEEVLDGDIAALRQARERLTALEAENAKLRVQDDELGREIAALESALSEKSRQLLGA